ncbi:MAG: NosD domain-containing protein [Candidatus Hydrothermales bacterium]
MEYDLVIPPIYMGYCYGGYWIGKFKSIFKKCFTEIYTHFMPLGYTRIIGCESGPYDKPGPYGPCRVLIPGKFHKFHYKIYGETDLKFKSWGYFKPPFAERREWSFVIEPRKKIIIPDSFYVPLNANTGKYYGEGKFPFKSRYDTYTWEVIFPVIMPFGVPFIIEIKNPHDSIHIPILNYGSFPEDIEYSFTHGNTHYGETTEHIDPLEIKTFSFKGLHFPKNSLIPFKLKYEQQLTGRKDSIFGEVFYKDGPCDNLNLKMNRKVYLPQQEKIINIKYFNNSSIYPTYERKFLLKVGNYISYIDSIHFDAKDTVYYYRIELQGVRNDNDKFVLDDTTSFFPEDYYYLWYPRGKKDKNKNKFIINFKNSRTYLLGKDSLIYAFILKDTLRIALGKKFRWTSRFLDTLSIPGVSSIYGLTFMDNYIYITTDGNKIFKIKYEPTNSNPNRTGKLGNIESVCQNFSSPKGITSKGGALYLIESGKSRVIKLDKDFNILNVIIDTALIEPVDIKIDKENYIWVSDKGKNKIIKLTQTGNKVLEFGENNYELIFIDPFNSIWTRTSDGRFERYTKNGNKIEVKEYFIGEAIEFNIEGLEIPVLYSLTLVDTSYLYVRVDKLFFAGGLSGRIILHGNVSSEENEIKFIDYEFNYKENQGEINSYFMGFSEGWKRKGYAQLYKWYPLDSLLQYIFKFPYGYNGVLFHFYLKRNEILDISPEIYKFNAEYTSIKIDEIYIKEIFKYNFKPNSSWDTTFSIPSSYYFPPGKYIAKLSLLGKDDFPLNINSYYFFDVVPQELGIKISPAFQGHPFMGDSSLINLKIWNLSQVPSLGEIGFICDNDTLLKKETLIDTNEIENYEFKIFNDKEIIKLFAYFKGNKNYLIQNENNIIYLKDSLKILPQNIDIIPEAFSQDIFYYDPIFFRLTLNPFASEGKIFSKLIFQKDTIIDTFYIKIGEKINKSYHLIPKFAKDDTVYLMLSTYTQNKLYNLKRLYFKGGGILKIDTSLIYEDTSFTIGYRIINPSSKNTLYKTYFYIKKDGEIIKSYSKEDEVEANSEKEFILTCNVPYSAVYTLSGILKEKSSEMLLDSSKSTLYVGLVNYVEIDTIILKGANEEGLMKFIFPIYLPYATSQFLKAILTHPAGKDTIKKYFSKNDTIIFSIYPQWEKGEYNVKLDILNLSDNVLISKVWRKKFKPQFYLITQDTFYTNAIDSLISVPFIIKNKGTSKGKGFLEAKWFEDFNFTEFYLPVNTHYSDTFYLRNPLYIPEGTYTMEFNLNGETLWKIVKYRSYRISVLPYTDKKFYSKNDTARFYLKIKNLNELNPKILSKISLPFYEKDTLLFVTGFIKNITIDSTGLKILNPDSQGIYVSPLFSANQKDTISGVLYPPSQKILKFRKCNIYGKAETGWEEKLYPPIKYYQFKILIPQNDTIKVDSLKIIKGDDTTIKKFPPPEEIVKFKFALDSLPVNIFYGIYLWPSMNGILLREYPLYEGDSVIAVYPEKPEYFFGEIMKLNVSTKIGGNVKIKFWDNDSITSYIEKDTFFYKMLPKKGLTDFYEINYNFSSDTIIRQRKFEIKLKGIDVRIRNLTTSPDTIYPYDTLRVSMQAHVFDIPPETTYICFDILKDDTIRVLKDTLFLKKGINLLRFSFEFPNISKGNAFLRYKLNADSVLVFYSGKWINVGLIDTFPPEVSFIYPKRIYEDDSIFIKAKIKDDNKILDTLFYRIKGEISWSKINSKKINDTLLIYELGKFNGNNEIEFYGVYRDIKGNKRREPVYGENKIFVLKGLQANISSYEIYNSLPRIYWQNVAEEFIKDKGIPIFESFYDTLKFEMPSLRGKGLLSKIKVYLKNPLTLPSYLYVKIQNENYTFEVPGDTSGWFEFSINKEIQDTLSITIFPSEIIFYADGENPVYSYYKKFGEWKKFIYGNILIRPKIKYLSDSLSPVLKYNVYREGGGASFLIKSVKDTSFIDSLAINENIYTYFIGTLLREPKREFIGNPYTIIFDYLPPRFSDTNIIKLPDRYIFKTRIYDGLKVENDSIYVPKFLYKATHDSTHLDTFFFTIPKFSQNIKFYLKAWDLKNNLKRFPDTGFIYIKEGEFGVIPRDTTLQGEILLIGDIVIPESVRVDVKEGTRFIISNKDIFNLGIDPNHIEIIIYGEFYANGKKEKRIKFEIQDTGRWFGIRYLPKSKGKIEYSIIKDAIKGLSLKAESVYIVQNEISENQEGIEIFRGNSFIFANKINLNKIGIKAEIDSGFAILSWNHIFENESTGVLVKNNPLLTLGNVYNPDTLDDGANRIYGNGNYDIINLTQYKIYAQGNFWNSKDSTFIKSRIKGDVDFKKFYIWGKIKIKTTWDGIVSIGGDLIIPKNVHLKIKEGTKIRFIKRFDALKTGKNDTLSELIVYGKLSAKNSLFTSDGYIKEKCDYYGIVFKMREENELKKYEMDEEDRTFEKSSHNYKNLRINFSYKGIEFLKNENLKLKNLQIRNSNYGIYFYGKELEIENSNISLNNIGFYLLKGKGHIKETSVKENEIGVLYKGTSEINIDKSYIMNNKIGIYISENSKPKLKNGHNYICYNLNYNLYNDTRFDIEAQRNWWGTQNVDSISLLIYDFYDDPLKGKVYFEPIWVPRKEILSNIQGEKGRVTELIKINSISFKNIEIEFILDRKSEIYINIYDASGKKIKSINKSLDLGTHKLKINNLKRGVYFIDVEVNGIKNRFKVLKI